MNKILTFLGILLSVHFLSAQKTHTESFSGVDAIKLGTGIGSVDILPSNSSSVEVKVVYDDDKYELKMKKEGSTLSLKEKSVRDFKRGGEISWTLAVPSGVSVDINSGTGAIEIKDVNVDGKLNSGTGKIAVENIEGALDMNSGTGAVYAKNCEGAIKMNSGTGSVRASNVSGAINANSGTGSVSGSNLDVDGSSVFNSGTGSVNVSLAAELEGDITVNSGTGSATLDFNGHDIEGTIVMSCNKKSGSISAPFSFDSEQIRNNKTMVKTANRGGSQKVKVGTGTGRATIKS